MSKYKIKSAQATDEVVRIFEENSLNVLATTEMRKVVDKVIVIGIFYFCITCILQKVIWANFVFMATAISATIVYIFWKFNNILYDKSKKLGGKHYKMFSKDKYYDVIQYNRKIILNSEIKLVKSILIQNDMYNSECMRELRDYLKNNKKKDKYDDSGFSQIVVGVYAVPITFNIINIYTAISKTELQESIINIAYIMIFAMTIVGIAYIIHIIKKVKMMSISNSYTYPRLIKILTNLIIMNSITPNKNNKYSHKNHKIFTKA